jgi:HEAT repeat protein
VRPARPARARRGSRAALRLAAAGALALALGGGGAAAPSRSRALSFEGQEARLSRELREGVDTQRIVAASELSTLSPGTAWPLIEIALADREVEVRRHAAEAAATLGLREALEVTRSWLESEDPDLREIAARSEGALGDATSVPLLSRALGDARFSVRSAAADALGRLGLEAAATPLGTALEDTDATVRVVAAAALGRTPGPEATRLLVTRSLDPALEVRVAVMEALARRRDVEGDSALLDARTTAVLVGGLADDAREVRIAAIVGLARARHAPAAPLLARIVEEAPLPTRSPRATEETREVRAALAALGRIDADTARAALVRALARGVAPTAVLDALRVQHTSAIDATEAEFARALGAPDLSDSAEARAHLVEGLIALAPLHGGDVMLRPLLRALSERRVPEGLALRALGATIPPRSATTEAVSAEAEEAMVALLAAVDEPDTAEVAIQGLELAADRGALDPRAVEALLGSLEQGAATSDTPAAIEARAARDARVLRLLGHLDDARATPALLAAARGPVGAPRRAAFVALAAATHLDEDARRVLLSDIPAHLGALDTEERRAIRSIAARHGDEAALAVVLDALESSAAIDRSIALELVVALAARVERLGAAMPVVTRARDAIVRALASPDTEASAAVSAAIVGIEPARFRDSVALAAEALAANASLGDRTALARAARASACTSTACVALRTEGAEHVLERLDAPAPLLEEELRFPHSVARSFALLEAARRGTLAEDARPVLCTLASRREPGVRANAGLALAALGARCEGIEPALWIAHARSVAVQLAGARWCASLDTRGEGLRCEPRRLAQAASQCLDTAVDPALVRACTALSRPAAATSAWTAAPERDALLDLTVVGRAGRPEPRRLVSIRFEDGATLVVPTDDAGRIALRVDHVVGSGAASPWVEDPYAMVLER